jgi:oligopeptide/dipeptide ABC transporter ATP-binding protein
LTDISLHVREGESIGIVGESGSGKSLLSKAILGDLPDGAHISGTLEVRGVNVLAGTPAQLKAFRRSEIAMVFQDPRASVNPVHPISDFLTEQVRVTNSSEEKAREKPHHRAIEFLRRMKISAPEKVMNQYPWELSGGMLQRVVIAGALMSEPRILLCDEATTALDVTTQAEIVSILRDLITESDMTLIFVTHDLELAGELCENLCVLYAGTIMEYGNTSKVLNEPRHPYTQALLRSTPRLNAESRTLPSISGNVIPLTQSFSGCVFSDRCSAASGSCLSGAVPLQHNESQTWWCWNSTAEMVGVP